ncbi:RNA-directed DNA polymerase (Reverse transcriptase), partial [Trifolium medium]|nr:RNA-directed DNA polymerase (Reverse transcriptase) [Trifolium medium]
MAIGLAIQHWKPYLIGRKFIVSTDQKSLKQLLQQRISTAEQQIWAAKLLGYDFEIVYKQGKMNKRADALSRMHEGVELSSITTFLQWDQRQLMNEEIHNDEELQKIVAELLQDPASRPGY